MLFFISVKTNNYKVQDTPNCGDCVDASGYNVYGFWILEDNLAVEIHDILVTNTILEIFLTLVYML